MKKTLVLLVCGLLASPVSAWEIKKTTDAMTDEVSRTVFVVSNDGSRFTLIRKSDNSVWGYLKLSGMNQFMINERLMLRIDKNEPVKFNEDLEKLTAEIGMKEEMWEWNPSLIGFRLWHGNLDEGCGLIQKLYDGEKMVIRYHPNQSTVRTISFTLTGNKKAISDALGFDVSTCPAG